MHRGDASARAQEIRQRRKAEAPFYVALHRWVLSAKHQHACAKHEHELLRVQALLMQGKISKAEMQARVRALVASNSASNSTSNSARAHRDRPGRRLLSTEDSRSDDDDSESDLESDSEDVNVTTSGLRGLRGSAAKLAATSMRAVKDGVDDVVGVGVQAAFIEGGLWHHCVSRDGEWEAFAGVRGARAEMLLRKQFLGGSGGSKAAKGVRATYRYRLSCRSVEAMHRCLFGLLRRFVKDAGGTAQLAPVQGSQELSLVALTYAPAEPSVQARWDSVLKEVTQTRSADYDRLLEAVKRLQSRLRRGRDPEPWMDQMSKELLEEGRKENRKSAKKKSKKKKKRQSNANSDASTNGKPNLGQQTDAACADHKTSNEEEHTRPGEQEQLRVEDEEDRDQDLSREGKTSDRGLSATLPVLPEATESTESDQQKALPQKKIVSADHENWDQTTTNTDKSNMNGTANSIGVSTSQISNTQLPPLSDEALPGVYNQETQESSMFVAEARRKGPSAASLAHLGREISQLVHQLEQTMARKAKWRTELQWHIQNVIQGIFPCAQVQLFGSHACGLALPSSDLDLFYVHRQGYCFASPSYSNHMAEYNTGACAMLRMAVADQLELLKNAFVTQRWVRRARIIKSSQMFIVRLSTCLLALDGEAEDTHNTSAQHLCPMCCEVDVSSAHLNGHSFSLSSDLLEIEKKRHPSLLPLTLVLKQLLHERNLLDPYSGGLSSISLSLLVLRYLQFRKDMGSASRVMKPRFSKRPGTGVVLAPPHADQFAYSRQLADWPDSRAPPPAYVQHQAFGLATAPEPVAQSPSATMMATSTTAASNNQGSATTAARNGPGSLYYPGGSTPHADPEAYHRQLADWPTSEAAHHFEWMRVMRKTRELDQASQSSVQGSLGQAGAHASAATASSSSPLSPSGESEDDAEGGELDERVLGEQLLSLLEFYGYHFKPDRVGITVIGRGAFYSLSARPELNRAVPQPIIVDNPLWPNLNVAKATYRINEVLTAFRNLHAILFEELSIVADKLDNSQYELPQNDKPVVLRKVLRSKWQTLL